MVARTRALTWLFPILGFINAQQTCIGRNYGSDSIVCVCNSSYCDSVPFPDPVPSTNYLLYTSDLAGKRMEKSEGTFQAADLPENIVLVNSDERFQTMLGWGGALTDSAAMNIMSLPAPAQELLLTSYFTPNGSNYNILRTPIASSDFSPRSYTYSDGAADLSLSNFSLQEEDLQYKIPIIKRILEARNGDLKVLAAAWIAPLWMQTPEPGKVILIMINSTMYGPWANYHLKFIQEYQRQGCPIWAISTGNQPFTAFAQDDPARSIAWTPSDLGNWIGESLGPIINSTFPNVTILSLDDQRYYLPWVMSFLLTNASAQYIEGFQVHWYEDDQFSPSTLRYTNYLYPNFYILSTEGSITGNTPAVDLGSWERGERYSFDIIQDCESFVVGWLDWNIALDLNGGPNWQNNSVDSPIIVNKTSGEFYKQPMYYHLAHFSKFVPEGSVRVKSTRDCVDHLYVSAFLRPDNGIAVVLLNKL